MPNLRNPEERERWRNDTFCTDAEIAGDMYVPNFSKGNPDIPDAVYENMYHKWRKEFEANVGYTKAVFGQLDNKK